MDEVFQPFNIPRFSTTKSTSTSTTASICVTAAISQRLFQIVGCKLNIRLTRFLSWYLKLSKIVCSFRHNVMAELILKVTFFLFSTRRCCMVDLSCLAPPGAGQGAQLWSHQPSSAQVFSYSCTQIIMYSATHVLSYSCQLLMYLATHVSR
jgi:hypothetical protein